MLAVLPAKGVIMMESCGSATQSLFCSHLCALRSNAKYVAH